MSNPHPQEGIEDLINEAYAKGERAGEIKALRPFVKALLDKGVQPRYHDEQVRHLETKWPTLYFTLRRAKDRLAELEAEEGQK